MDKPELKEGQYYWVKYGNDFNYEPAKYIYDLFFALFGKIYYPDEVSDYKPLPQPEE